MTRDYLCNLDTMNLGTTHCWSMLAAPGLCVALATCQARWTCCSCKLSQRVGLVVVLRMRPQHHKVKHTIARHAKFGPHSVFGALYLCTMTSMG